LPTGLSQTGVKNLLRASSNVANRKIFSVVAATVFRMD
jgi:hypothetical protein